VACSTPCSAWTKSRAARWSAESPVPAASQKPGSGWAPAASRLAVSSGLLASSAAGSFCSAAAAGPAVGWKYPSIIAAAPKSARWRSARFAAQYPPEE
jgi:hypothetical protein